MFLKWHKAYNCGNPQLLHIKILKCMLAETYWETKDCYKKELLFSLLENAVHPWNIYDGFVVQCVTILYLNAKWSLKSNYCRHSFVFFNKAYVFSSQDSKWVEEKQRLIRTNQELLEKVCGNIYTIAALYHRRNWMH